MNNKFWIFLVAILIIIGIYFIYKNTNINISNQTNTDNKESIPQPPQLPE